jgi:hypothetical protein
MKLYCINKEIDSPVIDNYSISRCQIYTQATSSGRKKKAEPSRILGIVAIYSYLPFSTTYLAINAFIAPFLKHLMFKIE